MRIIIDSLKHIQIDKQLYLKGCMNAEVLISPAPTLFHPKILSYPPVMKI